ncbi:MAG: hypothetical protein ACYSU0_15355, partial [Planctomycetota bacterium]
MLPSNPIRPGGTIRTSARTKEPIRVSKRMASGASVAIAFAILTGGPVPAGERRASTDKSIDASI